MFEKLREEHANAEMLQRLIDYVESEYDAIVLLLKEDKQNEALAKYNTLMRQRNFWRNEYEKGGRTVVSVNFASGKKDVVVDTQATRRLDKSRVQIFNHALNKLEKEIAKRSFRKAA